ncbi:methyltransferase domain-containing protein [Pseudomonas sp. FW306-02-F02-AA]|uniref:Methyltransferase n=1 Tax=Pseudomonas fluorescens TaxID=294 RepID=A0A0N9W7K3_PSEFL|nr:MULTISPECIES: methyltransferase domain-containing protein [Pseudomonas]ALI02843.1 methyltransferase [Pseudomonas fluorescens]PMZ04275.1 methyltransferase domain-containing protein [Pseudomonas sp. FW306-02-F02-AB]PMZ10641.1 methyltransferase domain-containing protein [Pseudomonas sp. FW306-02-H06C]PMZ16035.1 methyltransferase domain-containing protein [Pseudomonas sp. FW306-02-F02-AA]PMZ21963.1 methyltransferase domain-containing protein [Pseudomonas sp. FW306-02-F08-AA]
MDLKETDILGSSIEQHWYYRSKAAATTRLLGNARVDRILDVGAGSGFFSHHLLTHTAATEAWCVDISYEADSDATTAGKPVHYRRSIDSVDADLVLLMDVLEHVDDDVGLLKAYVDKVSSGSRFLMTVPAFQFLWSGHDDFLEHKRRYTLPQLERVAREAGLTVKQGTYYFGAVFPIAATLRLLSQGAQPSSPRSQLKQHHPLVNTLLKTLCSIERPFMGANRLAGLTVFVLAQKP